jgi:hypothetical protein
MKKKQHKAASNRSAGCGPVPASTLKDRASRLRPAQHGQSDAFTEVVELLVDEGCLDAVDLACLGSCSRAHRIAAEAVLGRRAMFLLHTTVQQAAANEQSKTTTNRQKFVTAVEQLTRSRWIQSSSLTAPTAAAQFLSISNVPQAVVKAIKQAGLRVNHEQLMLAVRARIAGVEVWVTATACLTLPYVTGVQTAKWARLPPWVKQLCTCNKVSSILILKVL